MKYTMKLLTLFFGMLLLANVANAESPREQLSQMVEQLQKSPNDNILRENIIHLAQTLKPAPAIPEEARRVFVRGNTAFSEAKVPDDYARAIQRYEEALVIAPWWGDPYFNLAKALELRQEYSRAIQSLKLFMLTGPSAEDVRKAQDYSYALEDRQEKLSKEKSEQEAAAHAEETKYGWLSGHWNYTMNGCNGSCRTEGVIEARKSGNQIVFKRTQGTLWLGTNAPTSWSEDYAKADGFIRGTISPSGEIAWEGRSDDTPGCPTSWSPINLDISSNHRTFNYELQRRFYQRCTPSGGRDSYMLTHE